MASFILRKLAYSINIDTRYVFSFLKAGRFDNHAGLGAGVARSV
jgi:hypothetical protein